MHAGSSVGDTNRLDTSEARYATDYTPGMFAFGPPSWIDWNGERYNRTNRGYYRRRSTSTFLHRDVWESVNGPVPMGYEIHHIDGDTTNNDIDNLECLTRSEHLARHPMRDMLRHQAAVYWTNKQPVERTCEVCGATYESLGQFSKYCSGKCHGRARRIRDAARKRDGL